MTEEQDNKSQSSYIDRLRRAHGAPSSSSSSIPSTRMILPMPPTVFDIAMSSHKSKSKSKSNSKDGSTTSVENQQKKSQPTQGECRVMIDDPRQQEHFAGVSFSMYKRTQVKKSLMDAMTKGMIEDANYWGAELVCCGSFLELWEVIFEFMSRNIGMSNPKLPVIITKCFQDFKTTAMGEFVTNQLGMRNSSKVRKNIAKVISILCTSRKRGRLEYVKIDKESDFDILKLSSRLKAPSADLSKSVIKGGDPTEISVAINEICHHISKNVRNHLMAEYWIEWLLEFDKRCRKKKERCQCERRDFAPQEDEGGKDVIFVVWDALFQEARKRSQKQILTIMTSLLELFKVRFTSGVKKKRRHLIYFAVSLLCEPLDLSMDVIQNETALVAVLGNIDVVYSQVKQGETTTVPELQNKKDKVMTEKEKKAAHKIGILTTMGVDESSM